MFSITGLDLANVKCYFMNLYVVLSFFKNRIKMHATQDRQYIQWLGGSIFSLISVFPNLCTTKAEFDECGPSAVSDRCFYNTK